MTERVITAVRGLHGGLTVGSLPARITRRRGSGSWLGLGLGGWGEVGGGGEERNRGVGG